MSLLTNKKYQNFIAGLLSIVDLDLDLKSLFDLISDSLNTEGFEKEKLVFKELLESDFSIQQLKSDLSEIEFKHFFESLVLLATVNPISLEKKSLIFKYANDLNFSESDLKSMISESERDFVKNLDFSIIYWLKKLVIGFFNFREKGFTDYPTYYSFRILHFLTNNRINNLFSIIAKLFNPVLEDYSERVLFGSKLSEACEQIRKNGYYVFPEKLPEQELNQFISLANQNPCYPLSSQVPFQENFNQEPVIFLEIKEFTAPRYEYDFNTLVNSDQFWSLLSKYPIIEFADQFFEAKSFLNLFRIWRTTPVREELHRFTGQVFHIDIDKPEALLLFVFLSDVDSETGSHIYIRGSHLKKSEHLLVDRRMTDQDIADYYEPEDIVEIFGEKGTVFAVNPIGFHKGRLLESDHRLALKYEFCNSGFGENIPLKKVFASEVIDLVLPLKEKYSYALNDLTIDHQ